MTRKKLKAKINLNKRLVFLLAKDQNPKPIKFINGKQKCFCFQVWIFLKE